MDATGYYYFFSSIAQTFGAILGVVGIFALFRFEVLRTKFKESIQNAGSQLARLNKFPPEFGNINNLEIRNLAIVSHSFSSDWVIQTLGAEIRTLENTSNKYKLVELGALNSLKTKIEEAQAQIDKAKNLQLKLPLLLMTGLIGGALFCLPFAKFFETCLLVGLLSIMVFMIGTIVSLWMTYEGIQKFLKDD